MTGNLDSRKYKLIQEIMKIDREEDLSKLEDQVESLHTREEDRFMGSKANSKIGYFGRVDRGTKLPAYQKRRILPENK